MLGGCYIPFDWKKDFAKEYLDEIRYYCLIMSENYIKKHFIDIKGYTGVIENRLDDAYCTLEGVLKDNAQVLEMVQKHNADYVIIDEEYKIDIHIE